MNLNKKIKSIIGNIKKQGVIIDEEKLTASAEEVLKKDLPLEDALETISKEVSKDVEQLLETKNENGTQIVNGISTMIYLPTYLNHGEYKLTVIGGDRNRINGEKIDEETLFDIASITKLFSLTLLLRLEKFGLIDLNEQIAKVNPDYAGLEDFTFNDLIHLCGDPLTPGRVNLAPSKEEAWKIMRGVTLKSNTREENKYTDLGGIIMSDTVSKLLSQRFGREMTWDEIMDKYLFQEIGITHNPYRPGNNVAGNGREDNLVQDPKARILETPVGSAGLFINSEDLSKLAKAIMMPNDFLTDAEKARYGEITFPNARANRGNLGLYMKTPNGLNDSYLPNEYSKGSFAMQGYTGQIATFDPNNLIHQNFLTNSVFKAENKDLIKGDKPIGWGAAMNKIQLQTIEAALKAKVIAEFHNKYESNEENIEKIIKL